LAFKRDIEKQITTTITIVSVYVVLMEWKEFMDVLSPVQLLFQSNIPHPARPGSVLSRQLRAGG
jgi:hypothetical protein